MAQASTISPELPTRLPLVAAPSNRDETTTRDARLVNCYVEKDQTTGEYHVYKRPGLSVDTTKSGNGYGIYNWKGNIYAIFGTTLYKNGTNIGTVDATAGAGVYRFSQSLGATNRLVFGNGVKAYTWDNATLAQITDADFPAAFVKGWAYLDATTYVMTATANIQGSGINDPTSWDALNLIVAQSDADAGVALNKQLVYVIAFKQWTTEVFYDATNATGSPLGTVQGARVSYGCASQDSVQEFDGILIWAATNRSSSVQVVAMEGLKAQVISTKPIERLLDNADFTAGNVLSFALKHDGHRFYALTLKASNITLVYDFNEKLWHQWTDTSGNYFPFVGATFNSSMQHLLQHETDGKIYRMDTSFTSDAGSVITVDIYTPNFDAGIDRRKALNIMRFTADQTVGSTLKVRKNDNDYDPTRWSNFRNVDLSKQRPFLTNCGSFYRRAYNFRHQSNTPLRMQAVDMQLDLGTL